MGYGPGACFACRFLIAKKEGDFPRSNVKCGRSSPSHKILGKDGQGGLILHHKIGHAPVDPVKNQAASVAQSSHPPRDCDCGSLLRQVFAIGTATWATTRDLTRQPGMEQFREVLGTFEAGDGWRDQQIWALMGQTWVALALDGNCMKILLAIYGYVAIWRKKIYIHIFFFIIIIKLYYIIFYCCFIWYNIIFYYFVLYYFILYNTRLYHIILHYILLYYIKLKYIKLQYTTSYSKLFYYFTLTKLLCCIILYCFISHYFTLHFIISYYMISHYITLYHII